MNRTLPKVLSLALLLMCTTGHAMDNKVNAEMRAELENYNRTLPQSIGPVARQEKSLYENGVVIHQYTNLVAPASTLIERDTTHRQMAGVFPAICRDPVTSKRLKQGVSYRFVYYGSDGQIGGDFIIRPSDCGF